MEKGYTMFSPSLSADSTEYLRNKLAWLRSRYDTGAVAPAVLAISANSKPSSLGAKTPGVTDSRVSASDPTATAHSKETANG